MLWQAGRCEIDLAVRNLRRQGAVLLQQRAVHAQQLRQPVSLRSVAPLLQRQLPDDELECVDGDTQFERVVTRDHRRDLVAEEIGNRFGQLDRSGLVLHLNSSTLNRLPLFEAPEKKKQKTQKK